jgi:hypothetical protein
MKLQTTVIKEGRYKTLTNTITNNILSLIKSTKSMSTYQRVKILYQPDEERPSFSEQTNFISLGTYVSTPLDMIFGVIIKLNRDYGENRIVVDGYASEGVTDDNGDVIELPLIELNLAFPATDEETHYTEIMAWLKDVVRHEIEHLTQRGINAKPGKHRNLNFSRRAVIAGKPAEYYKYYILADEIEPNLHGLRSMSRYKREPFSNTIQNYLDYLQLSGTIQPNQRQLILKKWRKVGKQLNLPKF